MNNPEVQPHEDWDPRDPAVLGDQRRSYDDMRERCPVAHSDFIGWSLFRYADVVEAAENPAVFSNAARHPAIPNGMDPPEHGRYRAALADAFTDSSMGALEPGCRAIARSLMKQVATGQTIEFVSAFAEPFALRTLCLFLGWPEDDWEALGGWTHGNQQAAFTRDPSAGRALAKLLGEHVQTNLDRRRASGSGGGTVTDKLLATEIDGQPLSDDEIASSLRNWIAGEGTVASSLSLLALRLAEQPDLQRSLRADKALIPPAVEEVLRADGPLVANRRTTTRAVQIGGRQIPRGATVALMWIAANRDPARFDEPDAVRLDRDTTGSLLWGHGIHVCLGAPLARLQLHVALEELLSHTSAIETSGPAWRSVYPSNGMAELRLRMDPANG
jgi:cytochrome P450